MTSFIIHAFIRSFCRSLLLSIRSIIYSAIASLYLQFLFLLIVVLILLPIFLLFSPFELFLSYFSHSSSTSFHFTRILLLFFSFYITSPYDTPLSLLLIPYFSSKLSS